MHGLRRNTVSIERLPDPPTISASGEVARTYTTVATNVRMLIQPSGSPFIGGRGSIPQHDYGRVIHMTHFGICDRGTDIRVNDRLVVGTDRYLVVFVGDMSGHHIEVALDHEALP